jgi:alkaline phosphatase D
MGIEPHRRVILVWILALLLVVPAGRAQTTSPFVSGVWSGNVTSTSAMVCVRLNAAGLRVRLVVSANQQLTPALFSVTETTAATTGNILSLDITGLLPNTEYYYGIEVGGVLRTEEVSRGHFRTFPQGAGSFKLALVGDGDYRHTDQRAYAAVLAEDPLLVLFNGDLHYTDVSTTVADDYRASYDEVLRHPDQGPLFRGAPVAYMWDDHDFSGGNNSNGTAIGTAVARTVYRDYAPHYPLSVGDGTVGQAFTIGRVRVIMTDLRSASVPPTNVESTAKTRLGTAQKAWFKQELIAARDAGFPLIIWVSSAPWIVPATVGDDSWGGYATERTELANFIRDNRIKNMVVFAGDMHATAYDDGTHSDYASGGGASLVVLHAAPLTADPNFKGGPYTAGPFLATQQYGIFEVADTGGTSIQCRFTGKRVGEGAKLTFQFAASATNGIEPRAAFAGDGGQDRALVNISARGRISTPTDTLIVGFVIGGKVARNILMRAIGPSLATFGVTDAVPFPMLSLFKGTNLLASNENWGLLDGTRLQAAIDRAGAFRFPTPGSRDAALYLSLDPGAYTMQVSSITGATGSVIIEAYEVP